MNITFYFHVELVELFWIFCGFWWQCCLLVLFYKHDAAGVEIVNRHKLSTSFVVSAG